MSLHHEEIQMTFGIKAHDLAAWELALAECKDSPGCFGTLEFMSSTNRADDEFQVYIKNGTIAPVKTFTYRKWRLFGKRVIQSAPINGLLGNPSPEHVRPILELLDKLSTNGELFLQISDPWNRLLGSTLLSEGFALREKTQAHRIDLPDKYEDWFKIKGVQRRAVRKSEKSGLLVKQSGVGGLEDFYYLYKLSHKRWGKEGKTSHELPMDRFSSFFELARERYSIYSVHSSEHRLPIAAAIVGVMGKVATYVYGATDVSYGHLRPANYLHASIIRDLIEKGVRTYVMGMSNNDRNVERFKEHLGAYPYPVFVYKNLK
jgi:hypothetical protein